MPLIDKDTQMCLNCGQERAIPQSDWIKSESDPTIFGAPPCPCGAQEWFCWHDDVEMEQVIELRSFPPEVEGGEERKITVIYEAPAPESYEALHTVLIGELAADLGVKQKKVKPSGKPSYPDTAKPKKASPDRMRELVGARHNAVKPKGPRLKRDADTAYEAAVNEAEAEAKQRKADKAKTKKKSSYDPEANKEKILPPGQMKKEDTEPKVDKEVKKIKNPKDV
jgi:hypothetical protein